MASKNIIIDEMEKAELKSHLLDFLQQHAGIEVSNRENFRCLNPAHEDSSASMHYYDSSDLVYCFGSCRKSYDIFDCIGFTYPKARGSYAAQVKIARELYGNAAACLSLSAKEAKPKGSAADKAKELPPDQTDNYKDWHEAIMESDAAVSYLTHKRQIPLNLIRDYQIGYDPRRKFIIFPVNPHFYTARSITGGDKLMQPKHCAVTIWNRLALHSGKPVFITESIIDALSIIALGFQAVALNSSNYWTRLTAYIDSTSINTPGIILALDADKAGNDAAADLERELPKRNIATRRLKYPSCGCSGERQCKDANEYLINHREAFEQACAEAAGGNAEETVIVKEHKPAEPPIPADQPPTAEQNDKDRKRVQARQRINAAKASAGLDSIFEYNPQVSGIPTELKALNKLICGNEKGGFKTGLYILMGAPGIGKTSLCVQSAQEFCKQGKLVLYLHMEQSRDDLQRKIISCLTHKAAHGYAAEAEEIARMSKLSETKRNNIKEARAEFIKYADNLLIYEDTGDEAPSIQDLFEDFKLVYDRAPDVMIIDYLQILPPLDKRALSDKQRADMNVTLLRKLARKHKFPIIAISSINRDSYDKPLTLRSIKESGGVEGGADVVIGVQAPGIEATYIKNKGTYDFSYDNYLKNDVSQDGSRAVEIVTLKNRGKRLGSICLRFYGAYHRLTEL